MSSTLARRRAEGQGSRPIVETPRGTRLCRPSEAVLDLLDDPVAEFTKEDGERVARPR